MTALHCLTYRDHASCSPAWCGWNMPTMPWSAQLQGFLSFIVCTASSLPCFRLEKLMFVGPFSIQRVISLMAVRLKLPRFMQVHPTVRTSRVKAPWSQPVLIDATWAREQPMKHEEETESAEEVDPTWILPLNSSPWFSSPPAARLGCQESSLGSGYCHSPWSANSAPHYSSLDLHHASGSAAPAAAPAAPASASPQASLLPAGRLCFPVFRHLRYAH